MICHIYNTDPNRQWLGNNLILGQIGQPNHRAHRHVQAQVFHANLHSRIEPIEHRLFVGNATDVVGRLQRFVHAQLQTRRRLWIVRCNVPRPTTRSEFRLCVGYWVWTEELKPNEYTNGYLLLSRYRSNQRCTKYKYLRQRKGINQKAYKQRHTYKPHSQIQISWSKTCAREGGGKLCLMSV